MRVACIICLFVLSSWGCSDTAVPVVSPPGYDLASPQKFIMSESLLEISGISFLRPNDDSLYAIEDEDGKLFYFRPGGGKPEYKKFGKRGDYEDITVLGGNSFVVLRSDGSLYVLPAGFVHDDKQEVEEYPNILPAGEYEGLYGDDDNSLYVLCKNCKGDDQRDGVSVFRLQRNGKGHLKIVDHFTVDVSGIRLPKEQRRGKFHPACLARHPITREWYIISSVNKVLLVLDNQWKLTSAYSLKPSLFKQPEGLAFDSKGNMYISNEGGDGNANVLRFAYDRPASGGRR
jgi:hypothetical protein